MSETEVKLQLLRVFTAFPSYESYLEKLPDGVATLAAWCKMLSSCDHADLCTVVDGILEGTVQPRNQFDTIDSLPLVLRGKCMFIKDKRDRYAASQQLVDGSTARRNANQGYSHGLGGLYRQVRQSADAVKSGQKTQEQHDATMLELRRKAREK